MGESHQIYTVTISMSKNKKCMLGWILFQFYIGFILGLIKKIKGQANFLMYPKI